MTAIESPGRVAAIAVARTVNAAYFVAVASYCFLSYTPFAYFQFIKPNVLPALTDFVTLTPWLFLLTQLITLLTLMPALRGARGCTAARAYVIGMVCAGLAIARWRPLEHIGNTPAAFAGGLLALVPLVWLALVDHRIWPRPRVRAADRTSLLAACAVSAVAVWTMYVAAIPWRLSQAIGINLSGRAMAIGLLASLVVDLAVFMALYLALAAITVLARLVREPGAGQTEFWLYVGLLAIVIAVVQARLVGASLAFTGRDAWIAAGALGAAVAVSWASVARIRAHAVDPEAPNLDALSLFAAPVSGCGGWVLAAVLLAALPFLAYGMAAGIAQFDWNFLLQKLGVLVVWLIAFCCVQAIVRVMSRAHLQPVLQVAAPIVAFMVFAGFTRVEPPLVLERYAAVDPSFRLVRDARTMRSAETAEYYAFLHSQTLVSPRRIQAFDTDFVQPLHASDARKPHIFLLVVDSMRRDYLSPYNASVTFTPEIAKLAADSFVFDRAFTRYSGTGMSVPSIWAGGMIVHVVQQPAFGRRNTLMKLVAANDYVQTMTVDNIVEDYVANDARVHRLGEASGKTEYDACRTLGELERALDSRGPSAPPTFFYALPQNVHIATAAMRKVPANEHYPGFFDKVAAGVHEVDTCLGHFVDFLKQQKLYDDSVIVLTSDHGDSLGEEGRWGHAFYLYPEVMRVPLIVHLPTWLKARVKTDVDAVAFSTDITPTLYGLLGYSPRDLGSLFGHPLFVAPGADLSWRRRESFLIASSYGAVYGMLRDNGRLMYVVDAVDGREYAFDLSSPAGTRIEITPSMTTENRRMIQEHLTSLAALYQYHPEKP